MVPKLFRISSLARTLSLSSLLLILLPAGGSASTPAPAPPAPPARMARTSPPTPPAPEADSDDQDHPKRGWLGVFLSEDEDGVTITGVKDGSPADKAGLKEGDKIIEIDGKKVDDSGDLRNTIRQLEPGDSVQVVVMRDNKKKSVNATLGEAPQHFWGGEGFEGWAPGASFGTMGFPGMGGMGMSKTYLGVRVQGMTEELRIYFKAPRGRGVLVSRVDEDTPAGKAGLRAGDVIIAVDGKGISDRGDIGAALADKEAGDTVAVKIVRDGSEKTIDVEVADRPTPKARHGSLLVPDEDKAIWMDEDDEEDLEDIHDHDSDVAPDNSRIQLQIERALREAHRAMNISPEQNREIQSEIRRAMEQAQIAQIDAQRQIQQELARVKDSALLQKEAIRRQVSAAMDQAREAMREAAEAARAAEESSGI